MQLASLLEIMSDYDIVTIFREDYDEICTIFVGEIKSRRKDLLTARVTYICKSRTEICIFIDTEV